MLTEPEENVIWHYLCQPLHMETISAINNNKYDNKSFKKLAIGGSCMTIFPTFWNL